MDFRDEDIFMAGMFLVIHIALLVEILALTIQLIRRKKVKGIAIRLGIAAALTGLYWIFSLSHSTTVYYNDWYVMGNDIRKVESKYGPFDKGDPQDGKGGWSCYYLNGSQGYWMKYNSEGKVTEIAYGYGPGG